jgi:hypothetical protein
MPKPDKDSVAYFLNDNLDFVRDKAPNLVTVAASLLPFTDAMFRTGVAYDDEDKGYLVYDICDAHLTDGVDMIAHIDEQYVRVQQILTDDDDPTNRTVLTTHYFQLPDFWEYLRTIPRGIGTYGTFVAKESISHSEEDED